MGDFVLSGLQRSIVIQQRCWHRFRPGAKVLLRGQEGAAPVRGTVARIPSGPGLRLACFAVFLPFAVGFIF